MSSIIRQYGKKYKNLSFNQVIGNETLEMEFKEFTFNCAGVSIDNKIAEDFIKTNKFDFNKIVDSNLQKYFEIYIPRYACGFWNSELPQCDLFIGVDDSGIIRGIPYKGKLNIGKIKRNINKVIRENIVSSKYSKLNKNYKHVIEIRKVKPPTKPNDDICNRYIEYIKQKKYIAELKEQFQIDIVKWRAELKTITQKLVDLVNTKETRENIIEYIKNQDPDNKVIDLLNTDYQLETKVRDEITELKNNSNNPYYWVTKWKDEKICEIKSRKPILNLDFSNQNDPVNIITGVRDMIPYWVHNNDDINLYVIHIKFYKLDTNENDLTYYDIFSNKWCECYRRIFNGEPACLPY